MSKSQKSMSDQQLVAKQRKARARKKRKMLITVSVILGLVLITVVAAVTVLRKKVSEKVGNGSDSQVLSAQVTVGSISTTVSGTGTLAAEDVEELKLLGSVEIKDYYVETGDYVEEGDLIATVSQSTLMSAMSEKQEELEAIDEELADASGEEVSSYVTTNLAGRVKRINVESGDDVATAMYEHGGLVVVSLDGYMAVDIESEGLKAGDTVSVLFSDDTTQEGTVEKQVDSTATILISDDGPLDGDSVKVLDEQGNELGSGQLYIHSPMDIVGYAGTISTVKVSENSSVYAGQTVITLTDTETSATYDAKLKQRAALEEELQALIKIYKEGGICAPISGTVDSIEATTSTEDEDYMLIASISSDTSMSITISVDETDILSLQEGQEVAVTIDSLGEDTYMGLLSEIDTTATSESGITSYSAVISLDKVEGMLTGMSASAVITIEGNDNAMLLPVDAVHQTSAMAYVYTSYDQETGEYSGMTEVTIGLSNGSYVEIVAGLNEGDVVYYTEAEEESFGNGMMDFESFPGGGMPGGGGTFPGGGSDGNFPGGGNGDGGGFPGGFSMP